MSAKELSSYGMVCIGTVRIVGDQFDINITDSSIANLECCIYAFLVGDEILRIGSSKARLRARLQSWQRDVSNTLSHKKSSTPPEEAVVWKATLSEHGVGQIFARQGTLVTTPVGEINSYLAEEAALIGRHRPRLSKR